MSETEDTEAGKIAEQLKRLHEAGAIRSKEDAEFYARFIVTFGAAFTGWPAKPMERGDGK